jgi:hypothetical protein
VRLWRAGAAIVALASASAWAGAAEAADGVHVRLRGAARIEAQGVRAEGGDLLLRGVLTDDANAPVMEGSITMTLARAATPDTPLAPASLAVEPCAADDARAHGPVDPAQATTDNGGRFCTRYALPIDKYVVHLKYAGSGFLDATSSDIAVDLSRRTCTLAFVPDPHAVSLDVQGIPLDATATLESDGARAPGAGFTLALSTESSAIPVTAVTDAAGHAHFVVPPDRLGPPGEGELRLAFAGDADAAPATHTARIERHARVTLDAPEAETAQLPAGAPEDGVVIAVTASAAGRGVTSGSVEATVDGAVVGAAPLEVDATSGQGKAKVLVTFAAPDAPSGSAVPIALRYVPNAPWYEPGPELSVRLPVKGRSPLRQLTVPLLGLAMALWFVFARAQRVRALALAIPRSRPPAARGEAKLDVLQVARHASDGWSGRVTDANDGTAVAAARVQIERPSFGHAEVLGTVLTDDDGRFTLPAVTPRNGDELAIEAVYHVPLRRPVPLAGELDAQMILRKRALVTRMVAWAKQRGRPFDARPDPTPGHVRRAAANDFQLARWAEAIEKAAFAGDPIDAKAEADVDRLAPAAVAQPALARPLKPGDPPPAAPQDPRALVQGTKLNP